MNIRTTFNPFVGLSGNDLIIADTMCLNTSGNANPESRGWQVSSYNGQQYNNPFTYNKDYGEAFFQEGRDGGHTTFGRSAIYIEQPLKSSLFLFEFQMVPWKETRFNQTINNNFSAGMNMSSDCDDNSSGIGLSLRSTNMGEMSAYLFCNGVTISPIVTFPINTWLKIILELNTKNKCRAKIWPAEEPEPKEYTLIQNIIVENVAFSGQAAKFSTDNTAIKYVFNGISNIYMRLLNAAIYGK